jgi:hypothetical protein
MGFLQYFYFGRKTSFLVTRLRRRVTSSSRREAKGAIAKSQSKVSLPFSPVKKRPGMAAISVSDSVLSATAGV